MLSNDTEHTSHFSDHLEFCDLCKKNPNALCATGKLAVKVDDLVREVQVLAPLRSHSDVISESLTRVNEAEVAVAQAVEFAQYVEKAAKGAMVERARHFLSMKYSQELAKRLAMRVTHDEKLVQLGYIGVYTDSTFNKEYMTICTFDGQSIPYEFKYQCVPVHIRRGDIRDG